VIRAYDPAAHGKGCDCPPCCQAAKGAARLVACIKGPGCYERSHGLDCNEVYFARKAAS
jgi:hypothetical protein